MSATPALSLVESVQRRVRHALKESGLDLASGPLVVAVSGGPDSLALLHVLDALRHPLALRLHVAHLDHGLRGEEGAWEGRFVREVGEGWGLPVTLERAEVAEYRRQRRGGSLEAAAREVRYRFLCRLAGQVGGVAVALGHTADDQAETVLLHLVRGTGLAGLQGMRLATPWPAPWGRPVTLLRPLLEVWRQETEAYCAQAGLHPRRDPSNRSLRFTRNRLRHRVLPLLEGINPAVKEALVRLAHSTAREMDFLDAAAAEQWFRLVVPAGGGVRLRREAILALHPALQAHLLRRAYVHLCGTSQGLEQAHIEAALALLSGPSGRRYDLPGGLVVSVGYGDAYLGPSDQEPCPFPPLAGSHLLAVPGETSLPGWVVTARLLRGQEAPRHPSGALSLLLEAEVVGPNLWVRPWRPGDRLQPWGMEGTKKLQDLFTDAKVPRGWRRRIPLVVSPRGIVGVVGLRTARWAQPTLQSSRLLSLEFQPWL